MLVSSFFYSYTPSFFLFVDPCESHNLPVFLLFIMFFLTFLLLFRRSLWFHSTSLLPHPYLLLITPSSRPPFPPSIIHPPFFSTLFYIPFSSSRSPFPANIILPPFFLYFLLHSSSSSLPPFPPKIRTPPALPTDHHLLNLREHGWHVLVPVSSFVQPSDYCLNIYLDGAEAKADGVRRLRSKDKGR